MKIFPPPDTRYARHNEHGGVMYSVTWAEIHRDTGLNGWAAEWDSDRDEWFVYRNGERHNGHRLQRRA